MATVGKQSRIRLVYPFSFDPVLFDELVAQVGILRFSRTQRNGEVHSGRQWEDFIEGDDNIHSAKLEASKTLTSVGPIKDEEEEVSEDWRALGAVRRFLDGADCADLPPLFGPIPMRVSG